MNTIASRRKGETVAAYRKRCEKYVEKVRKIKPKKKEKGSMPRQFMLFSAIEVVFLGLGYLIMDSYGFQWDFGGQFIGVSILKAFIGFLLWRTA